MRSVILKAALSFLVFLILVTAAWWLNQMLHHREPAYRIKSHQEDLDIVELVEHEMEPFGPREYIRIRADQ